MTKQEAELIDTLWNVNAVTEAMPDISVIELIDTLWNVNKKSTKVLVAMVVSN